MSIIEIKNLDFAYAGEAVLEAVNLNVREQDFLAIIGTSMVVYPAAGLINYVPSSVPVFVIDPNEVQAPYYKNIDFIKEKASVGVKILHEKLMAYQN